MGHRIAIMPCRLFQLQTSPYFQPMKQYTFIAAMFLILTGCTREQIAQIDSEDSVDGVETVEVRAYIEPLDTRTSYANPSGTSSGTFSWSASDKIRLHLSDDTQQFLSILSSSGSTATFLYSKKPGTVTRNGYALYPADPDDASQVAADVSSSPVVRLPAAYTVSDITSAGLDAELPLIAVNTEGSNLTFRHVAGLLRIRCDNVPAGTQTLVLTFDGRQVTGAFPVTNPATDAPSISTTTASGGNNIVTFTVHSTGLTVAANNVFLNVPLPCGSYTSFTVEAKSSSTNVLKTKTQPFAKTVNRGNGYVSLVTFPTS